MENLRPEPVRAEWMRSEGMIIFSELSALVFKDVQAEITDNKLKQCFTPDVAGQQSDVRNVVDKVGALILNTYRRVTDEQLQQESYASLNAIITKRSYTYELSVADIMEEAIRTISYFPRNILRDYSEHISGDSYPSIYFTDSLQTVVDVLRSPAMHTLCNQAAFAANGYWSNYSTGYDTKPGAYVYKLIDTTIPHQIALSVEELQILRISVQRRNQEYLLGPTDTESAFAGSTSGCPVMHDHPHYGKYINKAASLAMLSVLFNKSTEELTAPRNHTGIDIGLDCFTNLLERAAKLQTTGLLA